MDPASNYSDHNLRDPGNLAAWCEDRFQEAMQRYDDEGHGREMAAVVEEEAVDLTGILMQFNRERCDEDSDGEVGISGTV